MWDRPLFGIKCMWKKRKEAKQMRMKIERLQKGFCMSLVGKKNPNRMIKKKNVRREDMGAV